MTLIFKFLQQKKKILMKFLECKWNLNVRMTFLSQMKRQTQKGKLKKNRLSLWKGLSGEWRMNFWFFFSKIIFEVKIYEWKRISTHMFVIHYLSNYNWTLSFRDRHWKYSIPSTFKLFNFHILNIHEKESFNDMLHFPHHYSLPFYRLFRDGSL